MFRFTGLFLLFTLLSALLYEAGHCLFYWAQGIPAGMFLVKEYPLRDITDLEYVLGSAGRAVVQRSPACPRIGVDLQGEGRIQVTRGRGRLSPGERLLLPHPGWACPFEG